MRSRIPAQTHWRLPRLAALLLRAELNEAQAIAYSPYLRSAAKSLDQLFPIVTHPSDPVEAVKAASYAASAIATALSRALPEYLMHQKQTGPEDQDYGSSFDAAIGKAINLANAIFAGLNKDLRDVDLSTEDLAHADLNGVLWSENTIWPEAIRAEVMARSSEIAPGYTA